MPTVTLTVAAGAFMTDMTGDTAPTAGNQWPVIAAVGTHTAALLGSTGQIKLPLIFSALHHDAAELFVISVQLL